MPLPELLKNEIDQFINDNELNKKEKKILLQLMGVHANMQLLEDFKKGTNLEDAVTAHSKQAKYDFTPKELWVIDLYKASPLWNKFQTHLDNIDKLPGMPQKFEFISELFEEIKQAVTPTPTISVTTDPSSATSSATSSEEASPQQSPQASPKASPPASPLAPARRFLKILEEANAANEKVPDTQQVIKTESARIRTSILPLCESIRKSEDTADLKLALQILNAFIQPDTQKRPLTISRTLEQTHIERPKESSLERQVSTTLRLLKGFSANSKGVADGVTLLHDQLQQRLQQLEVKATQSNSPRK